MTERVAVAGAGIAGLGLALALGDGRREVTIYDRDPPPPDMSAERAFYEWERKGVTQLRHSHVFLGRLFVLIRDRYPALMRMLLDAGCREMQFADALPPDMRAKYRPEPGDEDLSILFARRTTLEFVMRAYAATLPGVRFVTDCAIRGIAVDADGDTPRARGLIIERNGVREEAAADIVCDATGRYSQFPEWLAGAGVTVPESEDPAGILYFTRHYRLKDGMDEPGRDGTPGAGDLGYIKYGVFAADNRHFSITVSVAEIEETLRTRIVRPEVFDAVCMEIPGMARWIDPARAEPVSRVFAMGNLKSVWRNYLDGERARIANFFAVGDAAIRTNPLYGRGCSSGVLHAHLLAEALDEAGDPHARARLFAAKAEEKLRGHFNSMVKQDLAAIRRAENQRDPAYRPNFKSRAIRSFAEDAVAPATRSDLTVLRAFMKGFHMHEDPDLWIKRPAILARILAVWAMPKFLKRRLYGPKLGPKRAELFAALGIDPAAA